MSGESVDYERAFAGALLQDPDTVVVEAVRNGVAADWFVNAKWRLAWAGAVSLWRGNAGHLDAQLIVTEANRLAKVNPKGFDNETLTLAEASVAIDSGESLCVGGYIAQLKGAMVLRSMRCAVEQTFAQSGRMSPEFACEELVGKLFDILSRTVVARTNDFAELVDKSIKAMRDAHQIYMVDKRVDYVPGLPTPWWQLTKLLNGLLPGFHILGARTSVGKTSFALQLVRFFAEKGLHVGFDSLDMNTRSFVDRFISEASRVSLYKANFGHTGERDMADLEAAAAKVRAWPISVIVEYDVDRLMNWCRVRKSAKMLDVLFIDFVQLLSYRGADRATDTGRMTRVSKTIKRIVNELDIPVIGLSQLNRDCERDGGREPMKADLRESGALEQDATTVWLLYHDKDVLAEFRKQAQSHSGAVMSLAAESKYLAERIAPTFLKVDKNQNGSLGKLPFVVYSNYFTWMLADWEAAPNVKRVGSGVTAHEEADYSPMFRRVHADWRHGPFEEDLRRFHVLLPEDLPPKPEEASEAAEKAADAEPVQTAPQYSQSGLPAYEDLPPASTEVDDDDWEDSEPF